MRNFTSLGLLLATVTSFTTAPAAVSAETAAPTAYAYQMGSKDTKWGFVSFPVNNIAAKTIIKTTSSSDDQIGAGEYVDGKYYTYTLEYDFIYGDGLEASEFVVWNANDFSKATSRTYGGGRVVDMTFDYTHNTMYALVEQKKESNGSIGLTALCTVDMQTGDTYLVGLPGDIKAVNGNGKEVEEHLVAIASDPADGTLYAQGEYRQLYRLDRNTGAATAVGARHKIAITNDFQTMAFATDGKLYHAHMHPDYEYFMQIDTANGALTNPVTGEAVTVNSDFTNNAARFDQDPQLTGLTFADKAIASKSPKAVTASTATAGASKPNEVTISWTLPTENYDGSAAEVSAIEVFRFGTSAPIATLAADATSYVDTEAPNGDIVYCVTAISADHAGFPAWTSVFAGADQLKAVRNLSAAISGNEVTVTWDAPVATVNGGYSDYENITYTVQQRKGTDLTVVAEGISETSFKTMLDVNGTYSYYVYPYSCGIEGKPAKSNEVTLAGVETLPYACGFEDSDGGTLWTTVNHSSGSYGWSITSGYAYQQLSGKYAQFKTGGSSTFPADDWFISPAIHMPAGKIDITYFACGGSYDTHSYELYYGPNSVDPAGFTSRIYKCENEKIYSENGTKNYVEVKQSFTVPADGDYRIAFKGVGASTYATMRIDNISLSIGESGIDAVEADGADIVYADGAVSCKGATAIDVYNFSGALIGHADSDAVVIGNPGAVIVRATIAGGTTTTKIMAK